MRRSSWLRRLAVRLGVLLRSVEADVDEATLPQFANEPRNLLFQSPRRIGNSHCIRIGDDVSIGPGSMIHATRRYPGPFMTGASATDAQEFSPSIVIGNRVSVTGYLTLSAVESVVIEDDALLASHIFISDHSHGFGAVDRPYKYQPLERIAAVVVGRGAWIGEHVTVMPGVHIGEMAIVGAHSVVTRSIPPRSIAIGSPARVIRRWDEEAGRWADPEQS